MLKVQNPSQYKSLSISCKSYFKPQKISIYLNGKKQKTLSVTTEMDTYEIHLSNMLSGINKFRLEFEHGFSPASVQNSVDNRMLYCMFEKIKIE